MVFKYKEFLTFWRSFLISSSRYKVPKNVLFVDLLKPVDGRNILVPNICNY